MGHACQLRSTGCKSIQRSAADTDFQEDNWKPQQQTKQLGSSCYILAQLFWLNQKEVVQREI